MDYFVRLSGKVNENDEWHRFGDPNTTFDFVCRKIRDPWGHKKADILIFPPGFQTPEHHETLISGVTTFTDPPMDSLIGEGPLKELLGIE